MENGRSEKKTVRNSKVCLSYLLILKCRKVFVSFVKLCENDNANIFTGTVGIHFANIAKVGFAQKLSKGNKTVGKLTISNCRRKVIQA